MARLDIVSGPSGAGKSTFAQSQPDWECVLNIDTLETELGDRELAAAVMEEEVAMRIAGGGNFTIDHVIDADAIERWIEPARALGFEVIAWCLGCDDVETPMTRVRQRKHHGGHGADDSAVRGLHATALGGFGMLTLAADESVLIDTASAEPQIVSIIHRFETTRIETEAPAWAQELTEGLPERTSAAAAPAWASGRIAGKTLNGR